jgi:ATP-dependent DNA helicase RecG
VERKVTVEKVTEKVTERVTENQSLILEGMKKNNRITSRILSEIVGISERKIKENIKLMKNKGLLKRIGPDRGGLWEVVDV